MGSMQLFTLLLLAISAIHLLFSVVNAVDQWLLKNHRTSNRAAKDKKRIRRSGWYVFFNPADLSGKQTPSSGKQPLPHRNTSRKQQPRPRATARF